jgi:AraC-like DNA-binding protein
MPLDQFVEYFWFYSGFFPDHSVERVLPDGAIELLIDLQGPPKKLYETEDARRYREYRKAWISGQHSRFIVIGAEQNSSMMGIHFRPGGAYPFLPFPVRELNDDVVDLELVWGPDVRSIYDRLLEAPTPAAKFQILEKALWKMSRGVSNVDATCMAVIERLRNSGEGPGIRRVAEDLGLSQRQLLRYFHDRVGLSQKALARVFRFQNALRRLEVERRVHWVDIACSAGYYDQSHFVKDFQEMTGLNPSQYLVDKRDYGNFLPIR